MTTPRPDALTDESEYERIRAEMLDWAEGRRSWVNLCMANPDDHANTLAQQARIAEMDAAEVAKRAYALVGLAARADAEREVAVLRELLRDAPAPGYPCRRCSRRDRGHESDCWYSRVERALAKEEGS